MGWYPYGGLPSLRWLHPLGCWGLGAATWSLLFWGGEGGGAGGGGSLPSHWPLLCRLPFQRRWCLLSSTFIACALQRAHPPCPPLRPAHRGGGGGRGGFCPHLVHPLERAHPSGLLITWSSGTFLLHRRGAVLAGRLHHLRGPCRGVESRAQRQTPLPAPCSTYLMDPVIQPQLRVRTCCLLREQAQFPRLLCGVASPHQAQSVLS